MCRIRRHRPCCPRSLGQSRSSTTLITLWQSTVTRTTWRMEVCLKLLIVRIGTVLSTTFSLMLTWVVALFRKSTPEMAEDESDGWHTVVSGSVLLPDEAMIPEARQELLRRVFEVAERPVDDDFVYDLKYNEE